MKYISTRGGAREATSVEAILMGIAPDGGLFVPAEFPRWETDRLWELASLDYRGRARAVLGPFLPEIEPQLLTHALDMAYGMGAFDHPSVAPVHSAGDVHYIELWHGPTCAFKDLALQLLPHLMVTAVEPGHEIVLLVATSGDTGKAALAGFAGVAGTRVIVFYPEQGVSQVQERQMVTQQGPNVHVVAVRGNFDDAQAGVKAIFGDQQFAARISAGGRRFSSANSINWGRLVPQIVYYFSAYLDLVNSGAIRTGERVNVAVPTGNFGNILAAYYARRMGLPVARLICASNRNHVLSDFFQTGRYDRNREFYRTSSPSMDILISSNLERLLFELAGRESARVRSWMDQLKQVGRYEVGAPLAGRLGEEFWGGYAGEEETRAAIARVYRENGYVLDPHTAVAFHVYSEYVRKTGDKTPTLIAATASPFKFGRAVAGAIWSDEALGGMDEFAILEPLSDALGQPVPMGLRDLDKKPVLHKLRCSRDGMAKVVAGILGLS